MALMSVRKDLAELTPRQIQLVLPFWKLKTRNAIQAVDIEFEGPSRVLTVAIRLWRSLDDLSIKRSIPAVIFSGKL